MLTQEVKLLFLLTLFCLTTNISAHQCPPAAALHHTAMGQHWTLNTAYANDFVILDSQAKWSTLTALNGNFPLKVYMLGYAQNAWYTTCSYNVAFDSSNTSHVDVAALTEVLSGPAQNPLFSLATPITRSAHLCKTTASEPEKCYWY